MSWKPSDEYPDERYFLEILDMLCSLRLRILRSKVFDDESFDSFLSSILLNIENLAYDIFCAVFGFDFDSSKRNLKPEDLSHVGDDDE